MAFGWMRISIEVAVKSAIHFTIVYLPKEQMETSYVSGLRYLVSVNPKFNLHLTV